MINKIDTSNRVVFYTAKNKIAPNFTREIKEDDTNKQDKLNTTLLCLAVAGISAVGGFVYGKNKNIKQVKKPHPYKDIVIAPIIRVKKDCSFENLIKNLEIAGIKTPDDILKNCTEINFIGSGANSDVYSFSNNNLENWVIKIIKRGSFPDKNIGIRKLNDRLEAENLGQAIAEYGPKIKILKRVKGDSHSIPNWSDRGRKRIPVNTIEARHIVDDINKISKFTQQTFNEYAKKLKILDDNGYKMDCFNPNNILVDFETKELSIIDFYEHAPHANKNTVYDIFAPLVDFKNFEDIIAKTPKEKHPELINTVKAIYNKCLIAGEHIGLKKDKETFIEFIKESGEFYKTSFEKVVEICGLDFKTVAL